MRLSLRNLALAGVLATGLLALGTTPAKAQGFGGGYYGGGYGQSYGGGYGQGYGGYYGGAGGYGQGYGVPTRQYYGNGGHDFQPHWHTTQTPAGSFAWYGNGAHDAQPHEHTQSAYGGYRGYSPSPFGGVTTSYYNSTPYTYMPW
jgi:hypothetical protein